MNGLIENEVMGADEALEAAREFMVLQGGEISQPEHPVIPWHSTEQLAEIIRRHGRQRAFDTMRDREKVFALIDPTSQKHRDTFDLFRHGFDYPVMGAWGEADAALRERQVHWLYNSGSVRGSKTSWAVDRGLKALEEFENIIIWFVSATLESSATILQPIVWNHLRPELRALNFKTDREGGTRIRYVPGRGFTEEILVLPNGSIAFFKAFLQETDRQQGSKLGVPRHLWAAHQRRLEIARLKGDTAEVERLLKIHNIGAVADESMTSEWFHLLETRCVENGAKIVWGFTPEAGISGCIRELVGKARTLKSRPAELLPGRKICEDCPPGHAPFVQVPAYPGGRVVYFHADLNPFSGYAQENGIRERFAQREPDVIERVVYGYARDLQQRPFPNFGDWNIREESELPVVGTNFVVIDPAPARNNFAIWVRVTPRGEVWVYREFPWRNPIRTALEECRGGNRLLMSGFGEWAVHSKRASDDGRRGLDGDKGPAQTCQQYGGREFRLIMLDAEAIRERTAPVDPHRRARWNEVVNRLAPERRTAAEIGEALDAADCRELVWERIVDPRAAGSEHDSEAGMVTMVDDYLRPDTLNGRAVPPVLLRPAPGLREERGLELLADLMAWNRHEPLVYPTNAPRFYITKNCGNTIWSLFNWTGAEGDRGASADPIHCLRYMAVSDLRHFDREKMQARTGRTH